MAALAQIDVADGKSEEALELAGRLKKALPSPAAGLALEGDIYMASRKFDAAVAAYAAGYKARPQLAACDRRVSCPPCGRPEAVHRAAQHLAQGEPG